MGNRKNSTVNRNNNENSPEIGGWSSTNGSKKNASGINSVRILSPENQRPSDYESHAPYINIADQ